MAGKIVDDRDVKFILWEQLEVEKLMGSPKFAGFGKEDFDMIIDEARKFAEEQLMPINEKGDHEGVKLENGQVKAPASYKPVYDLFCESGWNGMAASQEFGGQGLPEILGIAASEYFCASCLAFSMYTGLTRAASHLIETHCSEDLKKKYLPNMTSGLWGGTMCLTEPGAGSAVGDLKSIAKPRPDGKWNLEGDKIFISSGDHDMVENNIHLVLARAQGSPPGIKGISLFIVPKFRVKEDGSKGEFNNVKCPKVEEKMGIHGSATCELLFGDGGESIGELVGELNKGINFMFTMMNEARIGTGLQGQTSASAAYQAALRFTKERVQGVAIENMADVNAPRVEIIKHPDVRRMLLSQKAYVDGMRALIYKAVYFRTLEVVSEKKEDREKFGELLALLTPVVKAYCSDTGFKVCRDAVQCFGGYGYCTEYKVEQYLRDCKISSIYEGTNGIQALDLLGRKVLDIKKQMRPYNTFVAVVKELCESSKKNARLAPYAEKVLKAVDSLDGATKWIVGKGMAGDRSTPVLVASPYLKIFGDLCLGWLLLEQMGIADKKLQAIYDKEGAKDEAAQLKVIDRIDDAAFYRGKIHAGRFFIDTVLPEVDAGVAYIKSENQDVLTIPEKCF